MHTEAPTALRHVDQPVDEVRQLAGQRGELVHDDRERRWTPRDVRGIQLGEVAHGVSREHLLAASDLGAHWVGPRHERVLALAGELGLTVEPQWTHGRHRWRFGDGAGAVIVAEKLWRPVGAVRSSILSQGSSTQFVTWVQSVEPSVV